MLTLDTYCGILLKALCWGEAASHFIDEKNQVHRAGKRGRMLQPDHPPPPRGYLRIGPLHQAELIWQGGGHISVKLFLIVVKYT